MNSTQITKIQSSNQSEVTIYSKGQINQLIPHVLETQTIPSMIIDIKSVFGKSANKVIKQKKCTLPSMNLVDAMNEMSTFMNQFKIDIFSYFECERTKKQVDSYVLQSDSIPIIYMKKDSHVMCTSVRIAILRMITREGLHKWWEFQMMEKLSELNDKLAKFEKKIDSTITPTSNQLCELKPLPPRNVPEEKLQDPTIRKFYSSGMSLFREDEIELASSWFQTVDFRVNEEIQLKKIIFTCESAGQLKSLPQLFIDKDLETIDMDRYQWINMSSLTEFIKTWVGRRIRTVTSYTLNPIIEKIITGQEVPYHKFMQVGVIIPFGYRLKPNDMVQITDEVYVNKLVLNYNVVGLNLPDELEKWIIRDQFREFKLVCSTGGVHYAPCTFNDLLHIWNNLKSLNCAIVKVD